MSRHDEGDPDYIELSDRLQQYVEDKKNGYSPPKGSTRTAETYGQKLENTLRDRWSLALEDGLDDDDAERIVWRAKSKSKDGFHSDLTAHINAVHQAAMVRKDNEQKAAELKAELLEPMLKRAEVREERLEGTLVDLGSLVREVVTLVRDLPARIVNEQRLAIGHDPHPSGDDD